MEQRERDVCTRTRDTATERVAKLFVIAPEDLCPEYSPPDYSPLETSKLKSAYITTGLTRIIHERSDGLRFARPKTDEYP
jgi:hypothetical protein